MDNLRYHISATIFLAIFFIAIIYYGGHVPRMFALTGLISAAASQMYAQEPTNINYKVAMILQYFTAVLAILALFIFTFTA